MRRDRDVEPHRQDIVQGQKQRVGDASTSQGTARSAGHTRSWKRQEEASPGAVSRSPAGLVADFQPQKCSANVLSRPRGVALCPGRWGGQLGTEPAKLLTSPLVLQEEKENLAPRPLLPAWWGRVA